MSLPTVVRDTWTTQPNGGFGCLPVIKLGERREQDLCSGEEGPVWHCGHCREAKLLRTELPMLIPQDITLALPEPGLYLEGQRNFSATELWKSECWVRKISQFCPLLTSQGAPFLHLFVLKDFDFAAL